MKEPSYTMVPTTELDALIANAHQALVVDDFTGETHKRSIIYVGELRDLVNRAASKTNESGAKLDAAIALGRTISVQVEALLQQRHSVLALCTKVSEQARQLTGGFSGSRAAYRRELAEEIVAIYRRSLGGRQATDPVRRADSL